MINDFINYSIMISTFAHFFCQWKFDVPVSQEVIAYNLAVILTFLISWISDCHRKVYITSNIFKKYTRITCFISRACNIILCWWSIYHLIMANYFMGR